VQRKLSSGGTAYTLTQLSYDSLGRIDCTATRMNPAVYGNLPAACALSTAGSFGPDRIRQTKYDPAGHVTQKLAGVGTNVAATKRTMTYTNNGRLATLADGNGSTATYAYDGFDRLSQTTYPAPQAGGTAPTELFAYDANSNLLSHTLRDGTAITFTRDNLNRVTLKTLPGTDPSVSYSYDSLGRLTSANQTGNNVSFTYDALSRKLTETGPQGTVTSTFDLAGRRTSVAYPAAAGATNLTVAYTYLATGEVSTIMDGTTNLATYTYDNLGKRAGVTLGNGVVQSYTRDPISRLTTLTDNLAGATNDLTIGGSTTPITYNPAGQITSVMRSNDTYAWGGAVPVTRSYAMNLLNQYLSTSSGGTTTATFTNDMKGNLTSDSTNSFCYSSENLLTSKGGTCGAPTVALSYDPARRLYSVAGSTTTRFAYSGRKILADYDGANSLQDRYVFGPGVDEPIVEYSSTGVRTWLLADERGSIIARTNSAGALVAANSCDEYGIPSSNNVGLFQYTGQAWISQLGMNYYKTRIYSPTMGRFMQTDRIGTADNANLYAYVHNDPVNSKDSAGTCGEGCVVGIGIGIGIGVEMFRQVERTGSIDLSQTGLEEDAVGGLAGGAAAAGAIVFGSDTVGLAIYYGLVGAGAEGADDSLNGTTGPQLYNDMLFGAATGDLIGFGGLGLDALLDTSSYSTAFIADNGDFVIDAGGDFYTVAEQDVGQANAFFSGLLAGVVNSIAVSAYDEFGSPVTLVVPYADDSMSDSFSNDPLGLGFDDPLGGTSTGDPSNDPNDPLGLDPGGDSENGIGGGSGN
jgi:RHS repeat-associated protein